MASESELLDPRREVVDAAARLARAVAPGDDARFVRVFGAVLNAVDATELELAASTETGPGEGTAGTGRRRAARRRVGEGARAAVPDESVYSDPVFLANARWMIRSRRRIVGGIPAKGFPDCVAVGSADGWCCSGTLIAPTVVLTAGHCERDGCGARVFFGNDVDRPDDGRIVEVRDRSVHPGYRPPRKHDDVAVLHLGETIDDVTPRRIAPPAAITSARTIRLVGYGRTRVQGLSDYGVRRLVDVPLASNDPRFGGDPRTEFVAGAMFLDRDSCSGDSGGPAYVSQGGRWLLAGATSRGTRSSVRRCGDGGIYTWLAAYEDWLAPLLGAAGPSSSPASPRRRRQQPRRGG